MKPMENQPHVRLLATGCDLPTVVDIIISICVKQLCHGNGRDRHCSLSISAILITSNGTPNVRRHFEIVSKSNRTIAKKRSRQKFNIAATFDLPLYVTHIKDRGAEKYRKFKFQNLQELDKQLDFLNKRFNEAESIRWSGMFKKTPLW